jgi:hypothetical protein
MATLSAQSVAAGGTAITFTAAAAGDKFLNSGNERLVVKNGSGSPITVTIDSPGTCNFGLANAAAHDLVVSVAAGAEEWLPLLDLATFNDATGFANIVYSSTTTITVAVVKR